MILRILDVNFNRTREALRVIEDYARFGLESVELASELKSFRHRLSQLIVDLKIDRRLINARNIARDVGQKDYLSRKKSLAGIISANFKRLQEALRVLVEYSKSINPRISRQLEKLRFWSYELEQQFSFGLQPQKSLKKIRLCVLVPGFAKTISIVRDVIRGGADAIQLRAKKLSDERLIKLIRKIRTITLKHKVLFIVNDRVDLALLGRADGVHLGATDISVRDARQILGPDKIIGATTHNIKEALVAQKNGADYISVGPMFPTPLKQHLPPDGMKYLSGIARRIKIPYVAIGGINQLNLPRLRRAHRKLFNVSLKVAVSSGIIDQSNVKSVTRKLKKILR